MRALETGDLKTLEIAAASYYNPLFLFCFAGNSSFEECSVNVIELVRLSLTQGLSLITFLVAACFIITSFMLFYRCTLIFLGVLGTFRP